MIILSFYSHTLDGGDFVSLLYKEVDDFEVYAYHQKQFKKVTKKDLLGKWTLFFFYPADFTFVCPTELEDLQEKYQEFKKVNCEIYAISTDTHFAHKTWHDISENISKIEYPMIGDPTHTLTYDFDVFDENDGLAQRGSFIIDPEGKVVVYEVNAGNDGLEGSRFFSCSGFLTRRKLQGSRMHRARYADAWDDRFRTSKATY